MFSTLFAVVVALVIGHLAPSFAAAVRDDGWYRALLEWLHRRFRDDAFWRGRWGLLLGLVPVVLVVGGLQWLLDGVVFGLPALLFGVATVFYAWGPRDLDVDVAAAVDADDAAGRREALARLRPAAAAGAADGVDEVGQVFIAALRRWFGVLFWFVVLGAIGALLYRLVAIAAEDEPALHLPEGTVDGARRLLAVLDWPVAQLMALSLALVGNFDVVVSAWKAAGGTAPAAGTGMLAAVGRASVRRELHDAADEVAGIDGVPVHGPGPGEASLASTPVPAAGEFSAGLARALADAMSLVWRLLLAWLAVLALFVVAGWVN